MKFGVVTFPGSNCDEDMVYVLEQMLHQKVERLWHKDSDLKGADFIVLPGGFSYGDYLRSGAMASKSPIIYDVLKHAERGGYIIGICLHDRCFYDIRTINLELVKVKKKRPS